MPDPSGRDPSSVDLPRSAPSGPEDAAHPGDAEAGPGRGAGLVEVARWLADRGQDDQLDPALMAWLGPGTCPELAAVLGADGHQGEDGGRPVTGRRALELAPSVRSHTEACPTCSDRLRAMVSVRDLLSRDAEDGAAAGPGTAGGGGPGPVGGSAGAAGGGLETAGGGAGGGSAGGTTGGVNTEDRSGAPRSAGGAARQRARLAAAVGVGAAGAAAVAYLAWPSPTTLASNDAGSAVGAISRVPAGGSALVLAPAATTSDALQLSDVGNRTVSWQANSTAPWLRVAPASGRLAPGQSVGLVLNVIGAPVSGLRATVTVNGSDGSVAAAQYAP